MDALLKALEEQGMTDIVKWTRRWIMADRMFWFVLGFTVAGFAILLSR